MLLGVNAALVPDLSGERNVRLGCLAMGLSRAETEAVLPDIVELAGIGKSIYRPMKTYSSGMGARFLEEMTIVAEAVSRAFGAEKMNYECLGNGDAHLHWHLFPRTTGDKTSINH